MIKYQFTPKGASGFPESLKADINEMGQRYGFNDGALNPHISVLLGSCGEPKGYMIFMKDADLAREVASIVAETLIDNAISFRLDIDYMSEALE